jgi:hypothetical protein
MPDADKTGRIGEDDPTFEHPEGTSDEPRTLDEWKHRAQTLEVINLGLRRIVDDLFKYTETQSKMQHSMARSSWTTSLILLACLAVICTVTVLR